VRPFAWILERVSLAGPEAAAETIRSLGQAVEGLELRLAALELRNRVLEERLSSILELTVRADELAQAEGLPSGVVPTGAILRALYRAEARIRARLH